MAQLNLIRRADTLLEAADDETLEHISKIGIGDEVKAKTANLDTGTETMLKTWRMWMNETAEFMAANGCTMPLYRDSKNVTRGTRKFNSDDAHELFTSRWLGVDEQGRRYSWAMTKDQEIETAPKSKRLWAMERHLEWATERGLRLTVRQDSEFKKLQDGQIK